MENFWKWLIRANARGVFLGALLVLLLVIAWYTWREFAPPPRERAVAPGRRAEPPRVEIGLITYLDQQLAEGKQISRGNPFFIYRRPPPKPEPEQEAEPEPEPPVVDTPPIVIVQPQPEAPPEPSPPPPEPEPEPAPPPRPSFTLEYKGLFTRSDGQTVALVRDSLTGESTFFAKGNEIRGIRIGRVTSQSVTLIRPNGSFTLLKLGEPEEF